MDTFNDLFMGYVTVMHDAWVDFSFYSIFSFFMSISFFFGLSCLQRGHLPRSGLNCGVFVVYSTINL